MFNLTHIDKNIIVSRLYDKNVKIKESQLDNYMVDPSEYTDKNTMYNDIVQNCLYTINGGAY